MDTEPQDYRPEALSSTEAPLAPSDATQSASDKSSSSPVEQFLETLSPDAPMTNEEETPPPEETAAPQSETSHLEAEEATLLEGVRSSRKRDRIREVYAQRQQLQQELHDIREMVSATGMSAQDFAQTLEFGRLMNANDPTSLQTALQMVEAQRETLCQKLGVELPGIDSLAPHPDLAQDVQQNRLSRERALELAQLRQATQATAQQAQWQQQQQQAQQAFEAALTQGQQQITAYFAQHAQAADHPAKLQALQTYFDQPEKVNAFVQTHPPERWPAAIQWMYEQIRVAPAPAPEPLRAKSPALGAPTGQRPGEPVERLAQLLDQMGL